MPHRAIGILAGALCLMALFISQAARARMHDPGLPEPISTEELAQWFGPLLCEPKGTWLHVLDAHRRYLDMELRFRADEVDPQVLRWGPAHESGQQRHRSRWLARIESHDQQLFDAIAAAAAPEVRPVVDWVRTRRRLETCECGLEVQTQSVSFSLLSYSDVAVDGTPLTWASPQAARVLAAYDGRILSLGRAYLKAHRAWSEARAASAGAATADGREERETIAPELQELSTERNTLAESLGGGDSEDSWEPEDEGEATWRGHARALAWMGRRMQTQIEAALDPRTRLLFRLRIVQQVGDLSGDVPAIPVDTAGSSPPRRRERTRTAGELGTAIATMRRILERAVDPLRAGSMDLQALDALAGAHWVEAISHADEILRASRRRGDALFAGQDSATDRERARWEERRLGAIRQWSPLAVQAAAAMSELERQALAAMDAATEGAQGGRRRPHDEGREEDGGGASAMERAATGLHAKLAEADSLAPDSLATDSGLDLAPELEDLDDRGEFDEESLNSLLHPVVEGPLPSRRILDALGWSARPTVAAEQGAALRRGDLTQIVTTLRADALSRIWGEMEGILDQARVLREKESARPDADLVISILMRARQLLGDAEERVLGQIAGLVSDDGERLRLRLLLHSTRFSRQQWPLQHAPGMTSPLLQPVDLAGVLLGEIAQAENEQGGQPIVPSELATVAESVLARGEDLLEASASSNAAFASFARVALMALSEEGDDASRVQRLAAPRDDFARAVLAEIRLQRSTLEGALAEAPEALAQALRRRFRIAAFESDLGVWLRESALPPTERGRRADQATEGLEGLIRLERRRQAEALVDAAAEVILEQGTIFPDDWEQMPPAQQRLEQSMRRLRFEYGELRSRTLIALAAVLPPTSPAAAQCGDFRNLGWCLDSEPETLAQVMGVKQLGGENP